MGPYKIKEMWIADDTALWADNGDSLQRLVYTFYSAAKIN